MVDTANPLLVEGMVVLAVVTICERVRLSTVWLSPVLGQSDCLRRCPSGGCSPGRHRLVGCRLRLDPAAVVRRGADGHQHTPDELSVATSAYAARPSAIFCMKRVRYHRQNGPERRSFGSKTADQVMSVPPCGAAESSTVPR